jgi:gliding motility-associated-like protein
LFRQNDSLFAYITNWNSSTLTRFSFPPCNNASIPSSTLFTPPSYSYSTPGVYNIRLTVNEGMPDQSSVCKKIIVEDKPLEVRLDTTLCAGTPWHAGGAWQTQPGTYYDTIHVTGKCDSIVQTNLAYKPEIPVYLGKDTMMCDATPIVLRAGVQSAFYQWQNGSSDSTFLATSPGIYWVIVTKNGCTAHDSIRIGDCNSPLWFPNVFTPNGDRFNETFHPVGEGVVMFSMTIFDRWGMQVFETDKTEPGWDGRINGKICSDGVYMFIATYRMDEPSGRTYHAKGSVTLLR